jgi:hypothetical protein
LSTSRGICSGTWDARTSSEPIGVYILLSGEIPEPVDESGDHLLLALKH